jgi:hypothetical protein
MAIGSREMEWCHLSMIKVAVGIDAQIQKIMQILKVVIKYSVNQLFQKVLLGVFNHLLVLPSIHMTLIYLMEVPEFNPDIKTQ